MSMFVAPVPPTLRWLSYITLLMVSLLWPFWATAELTTVTIGTIVDGADDRLFGLRSAVVKESQVLAEGEFDVRFPESVNLSADWTLDGVVKALERLYADPEVDVVLVLGALASTAAALGPEPPKPVIAPLAIDPEMQGFPEADGASGVHNLCYVSIPSPFERDLRVFYQITPFDRLAVMAPGPILDAIPEIPDTILGLVRKMGIEVIKIPVGQDIEAALDSIPEEIDAVYVAPLFHLDKSEFQILVDHLIKRRLPSFSMHGHREVRLGLMAGVRTEAFVPRLARRTALNLQRILLGEEPGSIPVSFKDDTRLMINMATAMAIGHIPSWAVMGEADLLHEDDLFASETLSLDEAIERAVIANLALVAADLGLEAAEQQIPVAKAVLLPSLDGQLVGLVVDSDRAAASFGSQAERTASASIQLTQVLYSEPAWANLGIQRSALAAARANRESLRLDVVRAVVIAYLDLLRANNLERIRKDNLRLSRSNLDLARIRQRIGASGRSEVLRWESRIAADRQAVVHAGQLGHIAEVALNLVLHQNLGERFILEDVAFDDPVFLHNDARFGIYVYNPISFLAFIDFMVDEGLGQAPELVALDQAIEASRRAYDSARRTLFTPTVALTGDVSHRLSTSGAGSETGGPPGFDSPQKDDTDWSIALGLSMPIYSGGGNVARREKAWAELQELKAERYTAAEGIEQGIRSALYLLGSTFSNIELSRDAATAAALSLELVTDAYAQGAVSISELLDGQNAALSADLAATNAVYDCLIQLMEFERAVASFDFDSTPAEHDDLFNRLDHYFRERSLPVNRPGAQR